VSTRRTSRSIAVGEAAVNESQSWLERLFAPTRSFAHALACAQAVLFALLTVLVPVFDAWPKVGLREPSRAPFAALFERHDVWQPFATLFVPHGVAGLALALFVLIAFGRRLELVLGSARFVALYVAAGFAGAAVAALCDRLLGFAPSDDLVGSAAASWGVVAGVWGVASRTSAEARRRVRSQVVAFGLLTLAFGFFSRDPRVVCDAAGAATGLLLGARFFVARVGGADDGARARRRAATLLAAATLLLGCGLAAWWPTARVAALRELVRVHGELEKVGALPDDAGRGALADQARRLLVGAGSLEAAHGREAAGCAEVLAEERRLADELASGAEVAAVRLHATALRATIARQLDDAGR
jgi:membrane associated rhomboid family serine protease